MDHLRQNARILSDTEIRVTTPLTADQSRAFLRMTPMTFSVPAEVLDELTLAQITIHMHVLCCSMQA